MAVRDPLLQQLKERLFALLPEGSPTVIDDSTPCLPEFCATLEDVLRNGLKQPSLSLRRWDYWDWIDNLPEMCNGNIKKPELGWAMQQAAQCTDVHTAQGKGRLFIRIALMRGLLPTALHILARDPQLLEWYDPMCSIIGNEDLFELFLSLLSVASHMKFELDLQVSVFLDESWIIPVCELYEFVPCNELGACLFYIKGRVVITGLVEMSCIADDGRVQPGDMLDTVNGVSLHDASKGVVLSVLRKGRGKPIVLKVVKAIGRDGHQFPPLAPYYDILRQEVPNFCPSAYLMQHTNDYADGKQMADGRLMYCLQYLGVSQLGQDSAVETLSKTIANLLGRCPAMVDILFDIRETRVISTDKNTSKILFEHTYPDISSVGRYLGSPLNFAYSTCTGCDLKGKKHFDCYLFEAATKECSEEIVKRIATGFSRTRWSV
uniref:uncharacterized protein isoform X2 n=1 Tax=Myxine glutinosa TaxID=7769 RepID=UPI00358F0C9E